MRSVYYPLTLEEKPWKIEHNFFGDSPKYLQPWQIEAIATTLFKQRKISSIKLSLTYKCNYSCPMCPYHGKGYDGDFFKQNENFKVELGLKNACKILDKLADYGIKRVVLTSPGEAILNPHILEIIAYAKTKNMYVVMTTNGALCDVDMVEKLKKAGLDEVDISIDSTDRETYKKIRSSNETYFKNAVNAPILFKNAGIYVSTSYVEQEPNKNDFKPLFSLYSKNKINNIRWQYVRYLDKDANRINDKYGCKYSGEYIHGLCSFYNLIINTDGSLSGCCHMEFLKDLEKMPNVLECESFEIALRKLDDILMSNRLKEVCSKCASYMPSVESVKKFSFKNDYVEIAFPAGNKVYNRIPEALSGTSPKVLEYLYKNNLVTKMKLEGVL
ncbi:MAG: radical SAM protein [Helicobacteraceae bacterium]|nr:radical SAM protein [Helicobacteraceae bacterium]